MLRSDAAMAPRRRLPERSYLGPRRYFLTICCASHQPLLNDRDLLDDTREQFLRAAKKTHFEILAYCFLPDHVHLLVDGTAADSDLRRFVHRAKQLSGFQYRRRRTGKLWQRSYYDRVIRPHECVGDIARYIIENPRREGIVESASDYAYAASAIPISTRSTDSDTCSRRSLDEDTCSRRSLDEDTCSRRSLDEETCSRGSLDPRSEDTCSRRSLDRRFKARS